MRRAKVIFNKINDRYINVYFSDITFFLMCNFFSLHNRICLKVLICYIYHYACSDSETCSHFATYIITHVFPFFLKKI